MTDDRPSMLEEAIRHRDSIVERVMQLQRLEALSLKGRCSDDVLDEIREEIEGWNYGAGVTITIAVQMYGGGPAGGIEFECQTGDYGLEMLRAEVWHQDWFQERGRTRLDDDVAEYLFELWSLSSLTEGNH